jgi:hypothetical protein
MATKKTKAKPSTKNKTKSAPKKAKPKTSKALKQEDAAVGDTERNPNSTEKGKRPTEHELMRRFEFVEHLVLWDYSRKRIIEEAARELGIAERTTDAYIKRVRDELKVKWEERKATRREAQVERLDKFAEKMTRRLYHGKNDPFWSDYLRLEETKARIEGNYAPEKHDVTVKDRFAGWTQEELRRYIDTEEEPEWFVNGEAPPDREGGNGKDKEWRSEDEQGEAKPYH